jgi:TonB family protein
MKVHVAPYVEAVAAPPAQPTTTAAGPAQRRRLPLAIAAAIAAAALLGIGAYFAAGTKSQPVLPRPSIASAAPVAPPKTPSIPEPIVVASPTATTASPDATATTGDAAARQKAFEDAVKRRMQEEMMKLQSEYNRQLQQSKNAPIVTASAAAPPPPSAPAVPAAEERTISAAQLDQQRREAVVAREDPAAPPPEAPQTSSIAQAPAPQPAVATIQEGDVVDLTEVDTAPRPLGEIRPSPPPLAIRQHVQGSVVVTVFVSENGSVLDAKVLSGIGRFGVDDAALRAVRSARFSPGVKSGKRVKVWMPLRFDFKL